MVDLMSIISTQTVRGIMHYKEEIKKMKPQTIITIFFVLCLLLFAGFSYAGTWVENFDDGDYKDWNRLHAPSCRGESGGRRIGVQAL